MNETFEGNEEAMRKRDEPFSESARPTGRIHAHPNGNKAHTNGHASGSPFTFWVVLDLLMHRSGWLILGCILGAAGFFALGSYLVQPKFTAVAQLFRHQSPTVKEFFKDNQMTAETFSSLIRSPELLARVGTLLEPPVPPEKLAKCIKIDSEVDSDMIKVYLAAGDPKVAVESLNCYLTNAVEYAKAFQRDQAKAVAHGFLKQQVGLMDEDIQSLQDQFRGKPASAQVTNKLNEMSADLNALSSNLAAPAPSMVEIEMLTQRLTNAVSELDQLMVKYTGLNPLVKQQESLVNELKSKLNKVYATTPPSARVPGNSIISRPADFFNPEIDLIRTKLRSVVDARNHLVTLQHQAESVANDEEGMATIFAPANLKTVQSNMRMVKIGIMTVLGSGVGLAFILGLVGLVELGGRRVRTIEDVIRITHLPVLATLGDLRDMDEHDRSQWAFRAWTMLQGRLSRSANHGLVCGVTSSGEGEGRSTWIALLAEAASLTGFRVLTIATRPSQSHLELPHQATDNGEPAPEPAQAPEYDNNAHTTALTGNVLKSPARVTEQLTGPNSQPMVHIPLPGWVWNLDRRKQWRDALVQWRQIDNLVILVELPPANVAEAVLLGSNLPNLVWLADSGKADAAETRVQLETLRNARCNLVGAVLNRTNRIAAKKRFARWVECAVPVLLIGLCALNTQGQQVNSRQGAEKSQGYTFNEAPVTSAPNPAKPALLNPSVAPAISRVAAPRDGRTPALLAAARPPQVVTPAPSPASVPAATPAVLAPTGAAEAGTAPTNAYFSIVNPSQRAAWQQRLTVGPGDILNFGLYGQPELNRTEVAVAPDGTVSFLEAHEVMANGLTIDELRTKLDEELGKYRRSPRTIITPVTFKSKKYYVLGKVMTKGVYTLERPITVLEAVARAHGFENGLVDRNIIDLADFQRSFLARGGKRYALNFERLFQQGDLSQNIAVEPGDYIYFPSANVREVYVVGEVRLPGTVTYTPELTIMAAIAGRSGYTDRAFKMRVLVVRGSWSSPETFVVDTHAILDGRAQDFKLQPRDIIYVNSRPFIKVEEILDLAATAFIQSAISSYVGVDVVKPFQQ